MHKRKFLQNQTENEFILNLNIKNKIKIKNKKITIIAKTINLTDKQN